MSRDDFICTVRDLSLCHHSNYNRKCGLKELDGLAKASCQYRLETIDVKRPGEGDTEEPEEITPAKPTENRATKVYEKWKNALKLGVTATPCRT